MLYKAMKKLFCQHTSENSLLDRVLYKCLLLLRLHTKQHAEDTNKEAQKQMTQVEAY